MLLASLIVGSIAVPSLAQPVQGKSSSPTASAITSFPAAASVPATTAASSGNWNAREGSLFKRNWGVDVIGIRELASGYMLQFRYRVLDVEKSKALVDKHATPYLVDTVSGAKLMVPSPEKIGQLRNMASPQVGRVYWMIFSNPGRLIKPGSRVNVVIGDFHVDGLTVQ